MELFKREEEKTISTLKAIIYGCQTYGSIPHHLHERLTKVVSAARSIVATYSFHGSIGGISDVRAYLSVWLKDLGVLRLYQTILLESISLILDPATPNFRKCSEMDDFPHLIIRIYSRLEGYQNLINDKILAKFFVDFDFTFRAVYNKANCTTYTYDNVHLISDEAYPLVASMKINPTHVIKRGYFRLSIPTLNVSDILVEILHIPDGLAFFKVCSGNLPNSDDSIKTIFNSVSEENHQILELGKSLLYPIFRIGDLEINNINEIGAVITFSEVENLKLEILSLDQISWITQWKSSFQKFAAKAANDSTFIKGHMRFNKLNNIDEINIGLGLNLDVEAQGENFVPFSAENKRSLPSNTVCSLHRSKPLQIPLSFAIQNDFDDISLKGHISLDEDISDESISGLESSISDYEFHDNTFGSYQSISYPSTDVENNSMDMVITDENTVLSIKNVRISHWSNNSWKKISSAQLQLSVIRLRMGSFMVAHDPEFKNLHHLIIRLSDDIKCTQSTKQDIQLRVPPNELMCTLTGILNIRSSDNDKLLPLLNFYTTCHVETMSHSSTMESVSSEVSSVSSAMEHRHSILKCSSVIIPHTLTQDVIDSTLD
ncbi:Rbh1p DI49_2848 [Saccharomyces eubayanus]|uniref:Rbh1p n=1 Tax=Saccharomyces eubayanus TaxID=1080349 RepID=UPI0006C031C4|nr:hypothetical protein DI49_2848 [Saccharomyces eubayanus]KOG98442.1 hypothetical protein DI49_2848 [Saccharomyces eubayanus]